MPLDATMLEPDLGEGASATDLGSSPPAFDPSTARLTSPPPRPAFDPSTARLTSRPAFDPTSAKPTGQLDPVVGKSLEELGAAKDFNATKYALEHPDFTKQTLHDADGKIITGMDFLAKVNDLQERKPWEKPSVGGAVDFLERVWTQSKALAGSAIDAQNKVNRMRFSLLAPEQAVTFANEAVSGVESGYMQAVDFAKLIYGGVAKIPISVAHKLESVFGLEPSHTKLEELAKQKFQAKVAEAQQMGEVARGQGEFVKSEPGRMLGLAAAALTNPVTAARALAPVTPSPGGEEPGKTALTIPSIAADTLEQYGIEKPDPSVIAGISLVANPLNYIPVGAASGAISKELATLIRGTGILDTAIGARAAQAFEASAGMASQVAEKALPTNVAGSAINLAGNVIAGGGKALGAGFGKSAGLLTGAGALIGQAAGHAVTGGLGGAATAAGIALTGAAATRVGEFILRTGAKLKQGEGFLFHVLDAVANKPVTGAARGVLATLPLAALVDDKDAQASIVASGAIIGGATGATLGLVEKGFKAGAELGGHGAGKVFGSLKGPEVYSPGYGDAPLDSAHAAAMSTASPLVRSVVSRVREAFRNMPVEGGAGGRVEAYLLEPNQFKAVTGQNGAGFTQSEHIAPDGTRIYRIFLNKSGGAARSVFHEAAHALQIYTEQFHPDLAAKVHKAIQSMPEDRRQAFGDFYDLSRQLDNPGEEIARLTPEQRDQEIFAEMVGAALQGHPLDESLSPLAKPVWQAVGSALEDLGLYNPGMGGTPVPKGAETPMGMSPSFKVAGAVNEVMSGAGLGAQNEGPLASPQIFEPTGKIPKGKAYTPPKPPKAGVQPEIPVEGPAVVSTEDPSWAKVVEKVDTMGLTSEQQARVREVTENRQGPILIDYEGVPTPRPGTREAVRSDQEILYIREALGAVDPGDRVTATQMAAPIRWVERPVEGGGTNLNLLSASMSKFLENAWLTVKAVVEKAPTRLGELVPYPVEGGKITPEGNHQLIQDEILVSNNLAHGYDAQGNPIQRPESYQGVLPEPDPGFTPQRLEGDNATAREQFLNLLQGIEPPKTPRVQPPRKNPQTGGMITRPANIEAADLAAANQRPLAPAKPVAGTKPPKSSTFETGEAIQEVNPLRATYGELGIDLRNIVHEVPQELNIEHIKSVQPTESGMAARPTGLSTAGFMPNVPKAGETVMIKGPDGKEYPFLFDGINDWGQFGKGVQLTALAPGPGGVPDGGTFSFAQKSLVDKGYVIPDYLGTSEKLPGQAMPGITPDPRAEGVTRPKGWSDEAWELFLQRRSAGRTRSRSDAARPSGSYGSGEPYSWEYAKNQPSGQAMATVRKVDGNAIRKSETLKKDLDAIREGTLFGTSLNPDGTPWVAPEGADLDIVSVGAGNFPRANINPGVVAKLLHARSKYFEAVPESMAGLYNMEQKGPKGEDLTSIDQNVAIPAEFRENTLKFARENGQETVYNTKTGELIKAGGNGNTVLQNPDDMIAAAQAIVKGQPYTFPQHAAPSGATVVRKSGGQSMPAVAGEHSIADLLLRPGETKEEIEPISDIGQRAAKAGYSFRKNLDASGRVLEVAVFDPEGLRVGDIELMRDGDNPKKWTTALVNVRTVSQGKGFGEALTREAANILQEQGATQIDGSLISGKSFALRRKVFGFEPGQEKGILAGEQQLAAMDQGETAHTSKIGVLTSPIKPLAEGRYAPVIEAGATKETLAAAKKAWEEKSTNSPFFKKWSEGAPVLEEGYASNVVPGEPVVFRAFHGTTHKFDAFGTERGNPENSFGVGHYFTTDVVDAERNYKGVGPDLTIRIAERTDQLLNEEHLTQNQAKKKALKELSGGKPTLIDAYVKMKNPLVLEKNGGTRFTINYDEATGQESGNGVDLYNSILRVGAENGVDGLKVWKEIVEDFLEDTPASEVFDRIRTSDELSGSDVRGGDFARMVAQDMGYDGIVDGLAPERWKTMGILPSAKHVIVWDPTQIKSVENRGTFSAADERFSFAPKLPHAAKEDFDVIHYSSKGGLKTIDPALFGKGQATPVDLRGGRKSYFFVKGSELGQDTGFAQAGLNEYSATIPGAKIYDARGADKLGWYDEINREKADKILKDAGYDGLVVDTEDGRTVVAMFKPVPVEATGVTGKPGRKPLAGEFMATLPEEYSGEFDLGQELGQESARARARHTIGQARQKNPEAYPLKMQTDEQGNPRLTRSGVPTFEKQAYEFKKSAVWKELKKQGYTDDEIIPEIVKRLSPEFRRALKDPKSMEGVKWYEDARREIQRVFGANESDAHVFTQLLAATSAQTDPVTNFSTALDVFNQWKSGGFDKGLKRYAEMLDTWADMSRADWKELVPTFFRENPEAKVANIRILQNWLLDKEGILPRNTASGARFGTNSRAALDVIAGRWLEVNAGDKVKRYFLNLSGNTVEATVDRWAARWVNRVLNEGKKEQWRILPQAEKALDTPNYELANNILQAVAKKFKLTAPEAQAVLWFWEKQLWAKNAWTKGRGRELSSYLPQLARAEQTSTGALKLRPEDLAPAEPEKQLDLLR
jgi:hypothetical protein